jgi:type VI protein secretion system component Hcp
MLTQPNDINSAKQPPSAQEKIHELTLADLDAAAGGGSVKPSSGKLYQACCSGKHIPTVTIVL